MLPIFSILKKNTVALFLIVLVSCTSKAQDTTLIPVDQLVGKKLPELFGNEYFLRIEAHEAFCQMQQHALKDSIKLYVASSYRGFEHQKKLWNKKFKKALDEGLSQQQALARCMEFSAIPGTSRHHWGTEVDLIDIYRPVLEKPLEQKEFAAGGNFEKLYQWLQLHANEYGFYAIYDDNPARKGFHFEPWHYSFLPLASKFHVEYLKVDLKTQLMQCEIAGCELFTDEFLNKYVADYVMHPNVINGTHQLFLPQSTVSPVSLRK